MSSYKEFKNDIGGLVIGTLVGMIVIASISLTALIVSMLVVGFILLCARAFRGEDKQADDNIKYWGMVISFVTLICGLAFYFMYWWVMRVNGQI